MSQNLNRRDLVMKSIFGAGLVGLRSLATGIPASILMNPHAAFADEALSFDNPQFFLLSTSTFGDPFNANAPGTYGNSDIGHANDPSMVGTDIRLGSETVKGAQVWSTLAPGLLSRACFFHHATMTVVHPDEAKSLRIQNSIQGGEMLPSMLSAELSSVLKTVRKQPISLSGDVNETIYYGGAPQPLITPTTLSTVLSTPSNGLGAKALLNTRDKALDELNAWLKTDGTKSQKAFVEQYVQSKNQLRNLQEKLEDDLQTLNNDSPLSQIKAALILFKMNVTPVVTVHIPFGGDNHADEGLQDEIEGHKSGIATLNEMNRLLLEKNLHDKVTFGMFNVFGRTLRKGTVEDGRNHNDKHAVCLMIGDNIKPSLVGGVEAVNLGASDIDSKTGKAVMGGDITYTNTFSSMGKTLSRAVGLPLDKVDAKFRSGKVVSAALKI